MELKQKMEEILNFQREATQKYEELIREISGSDPIIENNNLKKEIEKYKQTTEELSKKQEELSKENLLVKIALKEQLFSEKTSIINSSKKKMELYFKDEFIGENNKLELLQHSFMAKLMKIREIAKEELAEDQEEVLHEIQQVQSLMEEKITIRKEMLIEQENNLFTDMDKEYQHLKEEEITEEMLQVKKKHNDLEVKIGLNWLNKIGILLLLLGVATAAKYTYSTWFNEYMRATTFFLMGGVMLGAGEWMNKKGKSIFSLGLVGGGIGILYFSVFSSYFMLNILTMEVSIIISVLITVVSLVLSQRYQSMTICGVSLVGGYLPFFSYVLIEGLAGPHIYIAMGYLFILNILVLGVSFRRSWTYVNYLSFLLNIPCLVYLATEANSSTVSITYALLTFIMYLAITLINPIREKIKLQVADLALLALNTTSNCLLVYSLFHKAGYQSFQGILALVYALIYLGLGQLIHKKAVQEKNTLALFYLSAITFAILMIPFQFGLQWASMGWLIQGILIIYYGYSRGVRRLEEAGWVILGLCFTAFLLVDFPIQWAGKFFTIKYTSIIAGLIYVFTLYLPEFKKDLFRYTPKGKLLKYYAYFVILGTWVYALQMTTRGYFIKFSNSGLDQFIYLVLVSLITGVFAYGIGRIKYIQDSVTKGISIALYILVDIIGLILNFTGAGFAGGTSTRLLVMGILVLYNIFVFFNIKELTLKIIKKRGLSIEMLPITMAIYLLGVSTTFMITQFNLANLNLTISIFFIIMSFVYIIYGLKKDFLKIRRFGLGLSVFATGKLFIFDLAFLETLGKIVAYFCFGLVLLGISFVYHKLKTSLDKKGATV